jgi:hypothetical protein
MRWAFRGSGLRREKYLSSGAYRPCYFRDTGILPRWIKQQEHEVKPLLPSKVAGKNEWKNTSAPPYAIMTRTGTNLIYFFGHCLCSRSDMSHMIIGLKDFEFQEPGLKKK